MSSEKQYKYIENKIKEAAEVADYPFNEASWKKIETLLDKEKDKHRPFFWIFGTLFFGALLVGGGIIYQSVYENNKLKNTTSQANNKSNNKQTSQSLNGTGEKITAEQPALPSKNTDNTNTDLTIDNSTPDKDLTAGTNNSSVKENGYNQKRTKQSPVDDYNPIIKLNFQHKRLKNRVAAQDTAADYSALNKNIYTDKYRTVVNIITPGLENDMANNENKTEAVAATYTTDTKKIKANLQITDIAKANKVNMPDTTLKKLTAVTKTEDKKGKRKKSITGFYILAAAGAEASTTKILSYKNSTIAPTYGAGLGYQFNRRLSIQTGFYAGAKKYLAGPNDYKVKAGSYLSTVKIIKVDANCMVYEVPITLQYNWLIKPKANYFAALGVSSYIMKKEKYNYTFERYNTQYTYPYDYTKNTHLLASLQFSLGVEKQIGRKIFIQAAPRLNIPLQGIGEGRVKIFTTGLQVGLKYFPFTH